MASMVHGLFRFAKNFVTPVPKRWIRPTPDKYEQELDWQGFITPTHWTSDNISDYPIIQQDLKDLEEYLLPVFWEFNQYANYQQNAYFLYQRVFIIGAFLTTMLAIFTSYFSTETSPTVLLFGLSYNGPEMLKLFSILTTIVSAITGYFTLLSQKGDPRRRWSSYRRLTEELRMTYFKFLSHRDPYNKATRVDELRKTVLDIRQRGRSNA